MKVILLSLAIIAILGCHFLGINKKSRNTREEIAKINQVKDSVCIEELKIDIQKYWRRFKHRNIRNSIYMYSRNNLFFSRLIEKYTSCILFNLSEIEVEKIFGNSTEYRIILGRKYFYYHCIDTIKLDDAECVIFRFIENSKLVDTLLIKPCEYPLERID